jgi:prepilin-type N-terminal cleavage/methylation domain-containing protein
VTRQNRWRLASGFTLLELMTVLTLILILATIATPAYRVAIVRAHESVLRRRFKWAATRLERRARS